jgi:redox-sensitive bicupin YhaK (pirin superfamily)
MSKDMTIYERYRFGEERLAAGDPLAAARALEPAVEEETASAALWLLLARAYFASTRLRPAQEAFERVVELDPTDHHARFGLGRTFERQSRYQEALAQYRMALALSPDPDYEAALRRLEVRLAPSTDQEPFPEADRPLAVGERDAALVESAGTREVLGLPVLEALPSARVPYEQVDPFILVHEGRVRLSPEIAKMDSKHPHRGFDNLWYVIEGSISTGHSTGPGGATERARLTEGSLLFLRTGRGVWHAEGVGADEVEEGTAHTEFRGVLFWVNLARKDKHVEPYAQVLAPEEIPVRQEGDATIRVLVGEGSPIRLGTPALILDVELPGGGEVTTPVPPEFRGFAYVLDGEASFGSNRRRARHPELVVLGPGDVLRVSEAAPRTRYLLMAGEPIGETPLFNGPFVD